MSLLGRALLAALAFASVGAGLQAAGSHYYVNDHLATTVGIADASGEIAALEADAFGSSLAASETADRYTGKPYDNDMGAFVFPFRNYRAEEGRWMTADPSGFPDGPNSFAFVKDLFTALDPWGLESQNLQVSYAYGGTNSGTYKIYVSWSWDNDFKHYSNVAYQEDPGWTGSPGPATVNGISYTFTTGVVDKSGSETEVRLIAGQQVTFRRNYVAFELYLTRSYTDVYGVKQIEEIDRKKLSPSSSGSGRTHGIWYE